MVAKLPVNALNLCHGQEIGFGLVPKNGDRLLIIDLGFLKL